MAERQRGRTRKKKTTKKERKRLPTCIDLYNINTHTYIIRKHTHVYYTYAYVCLFVSICIYKYSEFPLLFK